MIPFSAWIALLNVLLCLGLALRARTVVNRHKWTPSFIRLLLILSLDMFVQFQFQMAETATRAAFWLGGKSMMLLSLVAFFDVIFGTSHHIRPLHSYWHSFRKYLWILVFLTMLTDRIFWPDAVIPVQTDFGWVKDFTQASPLYIWVTSLLLIIPIFACIWLLIRSWQATTFSRQRKLVFYLIIAGLGPALIGSVLAYGQYLYDYPIADFNLIVTSIGVILISVGYFRYPLIQLTPDLISDHLLHEIPDMIFLLDEEQNIVSINQQVRKKLGGKDTYWMGTEFSTHLSPRPLIRDWFQAQQTFQTQLTHTDGTEIRVSLSVVAVSSFQGNATGYLCIASDLSQLTQYELELRSTHQQLEASEAGLRRLTRAAFHDLREPLRTISNFVQLIQRNTQEPQAPKTTQFLDIIQSATSKMERHLQGLSMLLTIRQHVPSPERVNWQLLVRRLWHRLAPEPEKGTLKLQGPTQIFMDRFLLEVMLMELLRNTITHQSQDHDLQVCIYAEVVEERQIIRLEDNGPGNLDTDLGTARTSGTLDSVAEKTSAGLGLSLVFAAAEAAQVQVEYWSQERSGTSFTLVFPRRQETAPKDSDAAYGIP